MVISVRFNGRRFPRVVSLRKGGNISFLPDRLVLDLEEYDALYLLKSNNRISPERWEFAIAGVGIGSAEVETTRERESSEEISENDNPPIESKIEPVRKGRGRPRGGKR